MKVVAKLKGKNQLPICLDLGFIPFYETDHVALE